ncbi:MAG TPA: OmpA family protein, partial [Myxococcota bacterium]|nr:OmpA family protein [Myxococcota bacterium]
VHTPAELLVSARWAAPEQPVWVRFGAGPGVSDGWGTPDFRAFVQVGVATPAHAKPVDSDGDGLLDPDDKCPMQPEDLDGFEDADGCPDLDDDADGVPDVDDTCRLEPEDVDNFEDADGCPDPDNDGDTILDVDDKCPMKPEDFDGFQDRNGCPDPDNDDDGVPDVQDGHRLADGALQMAPEHPGFGDCMNEAEVVNGVDDKDGCPDESLAQVKQTTTGTEIVILDKVYFDLDKDTIKKVSFPVLDAVVKVMLEYPQITKVEIQGHTDARASDSYNLDLSSRRAASVRRYLIQHGIAEGRLVSKGYGETVPVIPDAKTEDEHAQNRRVQFVILEMAEGGPTVRQGGEAQPTAPEE